MSFAVAGVPIVPGAQVDAQLPAANTMVMSGWPKQIRVVLRQIIQKIRVPVARVAIRIRPDGPDVLEVEFRTPCISLVGGRPDAGVVPRERRGHRGPVAERAIA